MNRSFLAALAVLTSLAPISFAQAQSHSHAGMPMQDHAAMPAASSANGVSTTPADNAMLAAAPTAFAVTFPHAMTLSSLKLTGSGGQATDVTVIADASPATTVRVPLPALAAGSYSAAWAATGADGHQMNGVVRFMVH
ncbi:copper resistance CopC family protein [uncultured Brevundimonas sp.]|uniref:copper resistance CopC family protein n=1 Tax=uncultured Brevundimonas sp. TaxID=213418 RepID=UPI0030EBD803|tara:strand:- start:3839 stop:4252 length:414 start_codon:yes stop_codon:yes gene_type:complete